MDDPSDVGSDVLLGDGAMRPQPATRGRLTSSAAGVGFLLLALASFLFTRQVLAGRKERVEKNVPARRLHA